MTNDILFMVVTRDRNTDGKQWSEYWTESYNGEPTSQSGCVVASEILSEIEAEKIASEMSLQRKTLMEQHYKGGNK